MKRQYKQAEYLTRLFHKEKRQAIKKCEDLGIEYYEVGKNDTVLYAYPENYVCIASSNDMDINEYFKDGVTSPESIFINLRDYEAFCLA